MPKPVCIPFRRKKKPCVFKCSFFSLLLLSMTKTLRPIDTRPAGISPPFSSGRLLRGVHWVRPLSASWKVIRLHAVVWCSLALVGMAVICSRCRRCLHVLVFADVPLHHGHRGWRQSRGVEGWRHCRGRHVAAVVVVGGGGRARDVGGHRARHADVGPGVDDGRLWSRDEGAPVVGHGNAVLVCWGVSTKPCHWRRYVWTAWQRVGRMRRRVHVGA